MTTPDDRPDHDPLTNESPRAPTPREPATKAPESSVPETAGQPASGGGAPGKDATPVAPDRTVPAADSESATALEQAGEDQGADGTGTATPVVAASPSPAHSDTASKPDSTKPAQRHRDLTWAVVALLAGLALGRFACAGPAPPGATGSGAGTADQVSAPASTTWTCSMHPQIRLPEPGQCPICQMDLIPVTTDQDDDLPPAALAMSENAAALAEIQTTPVRRRTLTRDVQMVGKVVFDETRLSYITAWVPSRLDRLYVDYTGVSVNKGDHLVEVYSPNLIATQQELLAGLQSLELLGDGAVAAVADRQLEAIEAARQRLLLWGLSDEQVATIEERGEPSEHITIHAPVGGVVVHKNAVQGDYVDTGTRVYTIADLTRVWVQLDAYEQDLQWLHYGQEVSFTSEAWPGHVFSGRISFIDPVLDDRTRTVKVRINVDNPDRRLKPDMFVRATVHAPMTASGQLIDAELAGLWMCPMHPEIVAELPGTCDTCGMALVPTAELGFETAEASELALVIPLTAPLITGDRAVVYVRRPGDQPVFEGREVLLGPRGAEGYAVVEGLAEGELVVTRGAFRLDSELQIRARPSMMNPTHGETNDAHAGHAGHANSGDAESAAGAPEFVDIPAAFKVRMGDLIAPLAELGEVLAADDLPAVESRTAMVTELLSAVPEQALDGEAASHWSAHSRSLRGSLQALTDASDLEAARIAFGGVSDDAISLLTRFGWLGDGPEPVVFHCPMALEDGADWIGTGDTVNNPYFGAAMLRCGSVLRSLPQGN